MENPGQYVLLLLQIIVAVFCMWRLVRSRFSCNSLGDFNGRKSVESLLACNAWMLKLHAILGSGTFLPHDFVSVYKDAC